MRRWLPPALRGLDTGNSTFWSPISATVLMPAPAGAESSRGGAARVRAGKVGLGLRWREGPGPPSRSYSLHPRPPAALLPSRRATPIHVLSFNTYQQHAHRNGTHVVEVFVPGLAGDGLAVAVREAGRDQLAHHRRDTAHLVEVHHVERPWVVIVVVVVVAIVVGIGIGVMAAVVVVVVVVVVVIFGTIVVVVPRGHGVQDQHSLVLGSSSSIRSATTPRQQKGSRKAVDIAMQQQFRQHHLPRLRHLQQQPAAASSSNSSTSNKSSNSSNSSNNSYSSNSSNSIQHLK